MSSRGLSTALDVSICLLLVSAAVLTLSTTRVTGPEPATAPTETLAVLAAVSGNASSGTLSTPIERLAAAAVDVARGNVTRARERTEHVAALLNRTPGSNQVIVIWEPLPSFQTTGEVVVGEAPPPTAGVDAVRVVIPIGGSIGAPGLQRTPAAGFDRLAMVVARAISTRLDPPCDTLRDVRSGRCPVGTTTNTREEALTSRLEELLRGRHADVATAREHLSLGRVIVIVRTWET
jgi:hypothetical protein